MNPIKIFDSSFSGKIDFGTNAFLRKDKILLSCLVKFLIQYLHYSFTGTTLWENPKYVSPAAHRSALKKLKAGKYVARVQAKAAHEANRPTEPTYKVDPTDSVFDTTVYDKPAEEKENDTKPKKKVKNKKSKLANNSQENPTNSDNCEQTTVAELG